MERKWVWVNGPVIVGAGPAGLAVGACLRTRGVPFVLLEQSTSIASLWQNRTYDSLQLHLPKRFCQLPVYPFPQNFPRYPSRAQFLSYLESYSAFFDLRPRFNQRVLSAEPDPGSGLWLVTTPDSAYVSRWLVAATGENAVAAPADLPGLELFSGEVLPAAEYKSGERFKGKRVLVVGCGNSGMEIALDLSLHSAFPSIVARGSVHVLPREVMGRSTFELAMEMGRWAPGWLVDRALVGLARLVLGDLGRLGLRRPGEGPLELKRVRGKTPVMDRGTVARIRSGAVRVVPGVRRLGRDWAELVDGRVVGVDAVVLATGYRSNVGSWLKGGGLVGEDGLRKEGSGLYAAGFGRAGLAGVARDAERVAEDISRLWTEQTAGLAQKSSFSLLQ